MPARPQRPCRHSGCAVLTADGHCEAHKTERYAYDRWRGSSAERGYDADWKRIRTEALKRDKYLCQHCLPRPVPATEVHHDVPIALDPSRRLDLHNLVSLCHACHMRTEAVLQAHKRSLS